MRVRRQRRTIVAVVSGLLYLGVVILLVSPLWSSSGATSPNRALSRSVQADRSVSVTSFDDPKPLPETLPGSSEAPATEAGSAESVTETVEATGESVEESSPPPANPSGGGGSSSQSGEEVIGFEG